MTLRTVAEGSGATALVFASASASLSVLRPVRTTEAPAWAHTIAAA